MKDFYPTPRPLIEKLLEGIDWKVTSTALEPSAGKGDIADYIKPRLVDGWRDETQNRYVKELDVIEINEDLQHILKGKEHKLVGDDFLQFDTVKPYDLIAANFPFSEGSKHLLHALKLIRRNGGILRAIVNAETLANAYTRERGLLLQELEATKAEISYHDEEFTNAERKTNVRIAIVKVSVQAEHQNSVVLAGLKKAIEIETDREYLGNAQALTSADFKQAMIQRFNLECRVGAEFIDEFHALKPYMMNRIPGERDDHANKYAKPLIELKVADKEVYRGARDEQVNGYLRAVREKYWAALLRDSRFSTNYTSNITQELERRLKELREYDFNAFNIEELEKDLQTRVASGIEKAILDLFDTMSCKYAYSNEPNSDCIHYYNGWKTNKAWKINKKVVMPMYLLETRWSGKQEFRYDSSSTLTDIVKVFNYLAASEGTRVAASHWVGTRIKESEESQKFRGMNFRYFDLDVFKKGTVHLKFKDQRLLDKFNIFGSQRRGWLPPAYGKKAYSEMDREEQQVIDEFQGREQYEKVMKEKDYYLIESSQLLQLEA